MNICRFTVLSWRLQCLLFEVQCLQLETGVKDAVIAAGNCNLRYIICSWKLHCLNTGNCSVQFKMQCLQLETAVLAVLDAVSVQCLHMLFEMQCLELSNCSLGCIACSWKFEVAV